uniref:Uncharacterized protein n=1 Tax=Arundo donax TaxID=35708 RepID=A0A0A9B8D0_ARUDO
MTLTARLFCCRDFLSYGNPRAAYLMSSKTLYGTIYLPFRG